MRRHHFPSGTIILCFAIGLAATAIADDNQQGGEFDREIVLMATTNAPAGATGKAELESDDEDGMTTAQLQVETEGLLAGTYTVNVTDVSGTNTFVLGTFDIGSSTNEDDNNQGDENGGSEADFPLPAGLNPMDVGTISITDSTMAPVLVGDFTGVTNIIVGEFDADAGVCAGPDVLGVHGNAVMSVHTRNGKQRSKFLLVAQGAPPKQKLTLLVNGVISGTARSDRQGKIVIKHLAKVKLTTVKSVLAEDAHGNVVMSVSF